MSTKYEEHTCPPTEEEEDEANECLTSPHSYPAYNPRFTYNRRQKSSLGKNRSSTLGLSTATIAEPLLKNEENHTDLSESTEDSQPTGPFTARTPFVREKGFNWMQEIPDYSHTPFNFVSDNPLGHLKNLENGYKAPAANANKPHTNVSVNDSGLDVSYPSSIFSGSKTKSIFNSQPVSTCKRNIHFNTPYKNNEDKENLFHTSEGSTQENALKNNQQSARLGLFSYKTQNDFENVNDIDKKVDISDSNQLEKKNEALETNPKKINLFNHKSSIFENVLVNSNTTNIKPKEYQEHEIKSQPIEHQPRVTLFDSKPNLFENKCFNFNVESNNKVLSSSDSKQFETKSQVSKNQRFTLFEPIAKTSDNHQISCGVESTTHNTQSNDGTNNESPKYIPTAHKTIFDRPFIFTAGSKPGMDKTDLTEESLSTPLDLSSGEYLHKVSFNNSEQSQSLVALDNNKETVNLSDHNMGNEKIANDSGINMTEQEKMNIKSDILLPTPLVLACSKSLIPKSSLKPKDSFDAGLSEIINRPPVCTENDHNVISCVTTNQHVSNSIHNVEQAILEDDKLQGGVPSTATLNQQDVDTKTERPQYQSSLNLHQSECLHPETDQLKSNDCNFLPNQNSTVDLNLVKTIKTSLHQSGDINQLLTNKLVTTKPEIMIPVPLIQSLQDHNVKMSKPEVPIQTVQPLLHQNSDQVDHPQVQSLQYQNLSIAKTEAPVQTLIPQTLRHKPEVQSVLPRMQSLNNSQGILPIVSTNLNKNPSLTVKSDLNQVQSTFSHSAVPGHKKSGPQLFSSTSYHDKFYPKEKAITEANKLKEEQHQNLVIKSMIPSLAPQGSAVSSHDIVSQSEPVSAKNLYNSSQQQIIPHQQTYLVQQPSGYQLPFVSHSNSKPVVLKQTPITKHSSQLGHQEYPSGNQLPQTVSHIPSALPFSVKSNEFIKPSNPAPRFTDRLSAIKNNKPPSGIKPMSNMQASYAISSGITTRMNQCLYVNGKGYTVLSILGRGGSSEVYQVLEPNTSTLMAVKCVDLTMVDHTIAEGYLNEIELLSRLQGCATVIKMFDHEYIKESKMLYVVMEKGDTDLSKLIRDISKTTKISMSMIIYYWTEMLTVVRDIHERGIIHSDLKPANFLLVSGRLKLIDFGIASSLQGDMTSVQKEVTTGTWNYMSPEAIRNTGGSGQGFKITYMSDVWSLGCILYNLVYGKTPFSHITHTWNKLQAIADPNHRIEFPPHNIPPVLDRALRSCFHRDPKQRPSVAQLLDLPYHTTVDQISLGQEVKNILPAEWWKAIEHLFSASKKQDTKKE